MTLTDYLHGNDAAGLMRLSSADGVWRAIAKHAARYTAETGNAIAVVTVGTKKAVRRDQLEAFAKWYETAVRYPARRPQGSAITISARKVGEREMAKRRLGVLIRRIQARAMED
jgi:hypothetical protein